MSLLKRIIKSPFFYLLIGLIIVFVNNYFLPFAIWDAGVIRPWFMLNGYLPYHDFTWIRMPLDLFIISGFYKIFGASANSYQLFCFILYSIVTVLFFFITRAVNPKYYKVSFLFFIIFLFVLFQNTEEGELLVGIVNLIIFFFTFKFLSDHSFKYLFLLGLSTGIAFTVKQNSALVIAVSFLTVLASNILNRKNFKKIVKDSSIFIFVSLIPFLSICAFFLYKGSFLDFWKYTILFLVGTYSKEPTLFGEGLWIVGGYILLLIPFVLYRKAIKLKQLLIFSLTFQILALFISLYPSYLSYRAFTAFPLVSIVAGFTMPLFLNKKYKIVTAVSFLVFLILISRFIGYYRDGLSEGFAYGTQLKSYGEDEYKIVDLIKSKTTKNDKIINYASPMIYLLADRFPKNKYIEPFPYLLKPYDVSLKTFTDNPPKIVIYDESLPADQPGLQDWPGIKFFYENYAIIGRFGNSLVVFEYNK